MAQQKVSDTLFEALDIIINKRIEAVQKDKTILCTVEDNSNAKKGEYIVSNSAAKFTAYSENTTYREGQNVWVLIPEGDYNNEKHIIGKYASDSTNPYIWVDPMDSYANMTGNILYTYDFTEDGLIANLSKPKDIFSGAEVNSIAVENFDTDTSINWFPLTKTGDNGIEYIAAGYDRMGISADFKTAFGSQDVVSGNYGLLFIVRSRVFNSDALVGSNDEADYIDKFHVIALDSSNMWGNPYAFNDYFTQSVCYDIDQAIQGVPIAIAGYFYQQNNFLNGNGSATLSQADLGNGELIDLDPNIFTKSISLSFGYAIDKVDDDKIFLFSQDSKYYSVDNNIYEKKLQARFIYVSSDELVRFAINSENSLKEYLAQSDELKALAPIIHWYRYKMKEGVNDIRAGEFWEEFYPDNMFYTSVNNLIDTYNERFKCILCYNNNTAYYLGNYINRLNEEEDIEEIKHYTELAEFLGLDLNDIDNSDAETAEEIWEQWASTDQRLASDELVFINRASVYDTTRDLVQGLRLSANDASNGIFNIYDATYGANNNLINSKDELIARSVKATFWSAVTEEEELNTVERLAWYVPKYNSMIKKPEAGSDYQIYKRINLNADTYTAGMYYTRSETIYSLASGAFDENAVYYDKSNEIFLENINDINNLTNITDIEKELFLEKIDDYYIIIDDEVSVKAEKTKEAFLTYHIKPQLKKHWTNNTIHATAYRYQRIYGQDTAEFTPTFGAKGTNGTDYTLSLEMWKEIDGYNNEYFYPPAWTRMRVTGGDDDDTFQMTLRAQLYDPNDLPVENVTYKWKIKGASEAGVLGQTYVVDSPVIEENEDGVIYECSATISSSSGVETFVGYLSIPTRLYREYIGMEGPAIIRYGSSGTGVQYYDAPYGIIDIDENIIYTISSGQTNLVYLVTNDAEEYLPVISNYTDYAKTTPTRKTKDGYYHLFPKNMYFNNVDYTLYIRIYSGTPENIDEGTVLWSNPLLVLVDPYGNEFLNNWGGALDINHDDNTIMAAVMGAGKKENDNTFTGLLMGDLPKVDGTNNKSGLLGYEHGEQSYGLFDDGTMFLGKASRAQIRFDGSTGIIQNSGYAVNGDYSQGAGMLIDLDGENQKPYINMHADNGAAVYIGTGGGETADTSIPRKNLYFRVIGPEKNAGQRDGAELIHIGKGAYYLQTADYPGTSENPAGLKIDLKTGEFDSKGKLTITGNKDSSINFGEGKFEVNGDGVLTAKEFNFADPDTGDIVAEGIKPRWMTFVTDVEGAIWKGKASVSVSGTVPYSYSYPTYTTATLKGTETATIIHDREHEPDNPGVGWSGDTSSNLHFEPWVRGSSSAIYGELYQTPFTRDATITGVIKSTSTATVNTDVSYSGSTTVDVVMGIKLKISKISMWALTNVKDAVAETTSVPIYPGSDGTTPPKEYEDFGKEEE